MTAHELIHLAILLREAQRAHAANPTRDRAVTVARLERAFDAAAEGWRGGGLFFGARDGAGVRS